MAVRRVDLVRPAMHVACFARRDGRLLWRQQICEAEADAEVTGGYLSNLLAIHEGTVYYNSNMGAVAALRAWDGQLLWVVTYPRLLSSSVRPDGNDLHFYRDLTPPLLYRDLVVFAPRDCQRIFALDAVTGALLWLTPAELAADAIHLLGVGEERLLASGDCLYWFDLYTGELLVRFPGGYHAAPGHARPQPWGYGRGLLRDGLVYWPTRDAIYVFQQQTVKTDRGWQPQLVRRLDLALRGATGGNLVASGSWLLIAGADRLYAFETTGRRQHGDGVGSGSR
jgi:outer membrane protein assembly factor BamB